MQRTFLPRLLVGATFLTTPAAFAQQPPTPASTSTSPDNGSTPSSANPPATGEDGSATTTNDEQPAPKKQPADGKSPSSQQAPSPTSAPAPIKPAEPSPVALPTNLPTWAGANAPIWKQRFQQARRAMLQGNLPTACKSYDFLSRYSPSGLDRAFASNQYALCNAWLGRMRTLKSPSLKLQPTDQRTNDEMVSLYGSAIYYGIEGGLFYGFATNSHSPIGFIMPMFLVSGASAGAIAYADSQDARHYGVPQSIATGMFLGFEESFLWTMWNQAQTNRRNEWEASTIAGIIFGMTTAGGIIGGVVANNSGTTPGRAMFVGSSATWGATLSGFITAMGTDPDDPTFDDYPLLASAIGLNVGAVLGGFNAGAVSPTSARVRFIDLGGIAGILAGGGTYLMISDESPSTQGLFASLSAGTVAGLSIGWYLTRNMPKDNGVSQHSSRTPLSTALSTSHLTIQPIATGGASINISGQL